MSGTNASADGPAREGRLVRRRPRAPPLAAGGAHRGDGGSTWHDRAALPALDIAVDPHDASSVVATVRGGVSSSTDGGMTFGPPAGPSLAFVSWAPDGTVYGLGLDGALHVSSDRGGSWRRVGNVPGGRPQAVAGLDGGRVLAATAGGVYDSPDGGRSFVRVG